MSDAVFIFSGTPSAANGWRFENTGTATAIALSLRSADYEAIRADGSADMHKRTVAVTGGTAELPLKAAYFNTGTATNGTLVSTVTVTMEYN